MSGDRKRLKRASWMPSRRVQCGMLATFLFTTFSIACGNDDEGGQLPPNVQALIGEAQEAPPERSAYPDIVLSTYRDSYDSAVALQQKIEAFLTAPSAASLQEARAAWLAHREFWGQTEVFRFYGGPIDNEETGVEGQINAWPLDESYVDYVEGYRFAWNVMLMEKTGEVEFLVSSPRSGKRWVVDPVDYLRPWQVKMMSTQPDMILTFSHFLAKDFEARGEGEVEVRVDAQAALNGRPSQPYLDPRVDLAHEREGFGHKTWILPFVDRQPYSLVQR